nr:Nematode fatty acid retinoid binding domain containing protein [Haemonchus contortus]
MFLEIVLGAVLLGLSSSDHAYKIDDIPATYKELMPKEAKNYLNTLSKTDKAAIMEIAKNFAKYRSEEEALAALKAKAPELGDRVEEYRQNIQKRIDALGPEAKKYANDVVAMAHKIHVSIADGKKLTAADLKNSVQIEVDRYNELSEQARRELRMQFPIIHSFVKGEKMQKMIKKWLTGTRL